MCQAMDFTTPIIKSDRTSQARVLGSALCWWGTGQHPGLAKRMVPADRCTQTPTPGRRRMFTALARRRRLRAPAAPPLTAPGARRPPLAGRRCDGGISISYLLSRF
jgi:hypothetical protein